MGHFIASTTSPILLGMLSCFLILGSSFNPWVEYSRYNESIETWKLIRLQ